MLVYNAFSHHLSFCTIFVLVLCKPVHFVYFTQREGHGASVFLQTT